MILDPTDLTIIIPTLNWAEGDFQIKINYSLDLCLLSLCKSISNLTKMIVVSNSGDPRPLPMSINENIVKRMNLWEQGQCKAVNAAAATVSTQWLMITNDDMIYPPDWMEKLFDSDKMYPCFSPMLVEPQPGAPTFIVDFLGGAGGDFDQHKFNEKYTGFHYQGWRTGFNMPLVIRKELWDLIGGYDVLYDPWGSNSDSDLEYKIKLAGIQPMQNTDCPVYHFSQTSGTFHPSKQEYWQKNYDYFKAKWGFERVDSPEIWTANFEIPYQLLKYRPFWAKLPEGNEL
jgi:GT2 family glycosyltransferase